MINIDPLTDVALHLEGHIVNPNIITQPQSHVLTGDNPEVTPGDSLTGVGLGCFYNS